MPARGVGDVDPVQPVARCPQGGSACVVVVNPQSKFPVVIIHFLCPGDAIKIHGQQISVMNLSKKNAEIRLFIYFFNAEGDRKYN